MTGSSLAARHILVTGAGSGIGAATARLLGAEGAILTLAGRRMAALEETRLTLAEPDRHGCISLDVTEGFAVGSGVTDAEQLRGPLYGLVAAAGAPYSSPTARNSDELWRAALAVNLDGVFHCIRAVLPGMSARRSGRIVAIASTAGLIGYRYAAAYCAAKHGVIGLVRAIALEVARSGVTINAVCPGATDTPFLDQTVRTICEKTGGSREDALAAMASPNPQQRLVLAEEVASAVLWLCSDGAASTNGQAITVDGGETSG